MTRMHKGRRPHRTPGITGNLRRLPVIEPDASTCYAGVEAALEASEQFSRVAMVRLTPPVLDTEAEENPVHERTGKGGFRTGHGP